MYNHTDLGIIRRSFPDADFEYQRHNKGQHSSQAVMGSTSANELGGGNEMRGWELSLILFIKHN